MARRPDDDSLPLSPLARRYGGWLAAALLVAGIAVVFRILGGNGDGTVIDPTASASSATAAGATISFGTALDPATGEVAAGARTTQFADGDSFVYSVPPSGTVPPAIYVEVRRTSGGAAETVQAPVEAQVLPNPAVIAFTVPAAALLAAFGPGEYLMLIYPDPAGDPIAEGAFGLVDPLASPAPSTGGDARPLPSGT
jgi:hypothetical protein